MSQGNETKLDLKISLRARKKETMLILKKDLKKVVACFQSTDPFFILLLKQPSAFRICQRMGFDKQDEDSLDTSKSIIRKAS